MKRIKKILIISFLWLFIITVFGVIGVEAQREIEFRPQVALPGYTPRPFGETGSTQYIAEYVVAIYRYGVSIGAILATVVLMAAGLMWLTSGGSQEKIGQAKNMISGSIIGLVLLFGSYTILNTINPELVDFYIRDIKHIDPFSLNYGCCQLPEEIMYFQGTSFAQNKAIMSTQLDCENEEVNGRWFANRAPNIRPFTATMTNQEFSFSNACVARDGCCSVIAGGVDLSGGVSTFIWEFPSSRIACHEGGYNFQIATLISTYKNEPCEYTNTLDCSLATNGTQCYNDKNTLTTCSREGSCGFCYYGSCINTLGLEGDICGKGSFATCETSCDSNKIDNSARRCSGNLECCRY